MDNPHKRKGKNSSDDEEGGDGNQTSRARASITDLPDGETYEVFLNFRGEDTRKAFTDHLYQRLKNAGVRVFRDNEALRVGEEIGRELDKAIKASKISIPIISSNYAFSEWCLCELVHILECKKTGGQLVLPIFYRVDPSSIRKQTGMFEKAFYLHEKKYGPNSKFVQEWRNALAEITSLKGWESSKTADGHEGELIEIVATKVLNELRKATLDVTDCLVGIEDHKEKILKMVEGKESSDAQAIVIHGIGGVGKTTLAKVVYNQLSTSFKHCCYLPNIRERLSEQKCHPKELQKQLISDIQGRQCQDEIPHVDGGINIIKDRFKEKKVLILFDDVDCTAQLDSLARNRSWFKSGSILLITTRNRDVLNTWGEGRLTHELNGLDPSLSYLLFCRHAFRKDECRLKEFRTIAKGIVSITGGLPLAIEVIGSILLGKSKDYWEGVFEKLRDIPHEDVQKKLRITYDALTPNQKQIFLDIACLSIHKRIDFAIYMWDSCKLYPKEGIEKLISLSLIKMGEKNEIIIHDQLRDLGRAIVREEDIIEPGNRSRLWDKEEAREVMQSNQGTAKVQALNLVLDVKSFDLEHSYDYEVPKEDRDFTSEQFKDMRKLRYLWLKNTNLVGDFKNILLDLRWLEWEVPDVPCDSLPTNFRPMKLVVLHLSNSSITEEWEGWTQIELVKNLKVLNLEHCPHMASTPDFSAFQKLEILILRGCWKLRRIHPSICNLNKTLLTLDVRDCGRLEELPNEMWEMEELRHLLVDYTAIITIPISKGRMTKLENLSANRCAHLQHLPASIGSLINLISLSLNGCSSLTMLPESIGNLTKLENLSASQCRSLEHLPDSIGSLINLVSLSLDGCSSLTMFPESIGNLTKLKNLSAFDCRSLQHLPDSIGSLINLVSLSLSACSSLTMLPESIGNLTKLENLSAFDCRSLQHLPNSVGLLVNLVSLSLNGCSSLTMLPESIGNLIELENLSTYYCESLQHLPESIGSLINLVSLSLDGCFSLTMFPKYIGNLTKLENLSASYCRSFQYLPDSIGSLINLVSLSLDGCYSLITLPESIGNLTKLENLSANRCAHLRYLPDSIGSLINLVSLSLDGCSSLTMLSESIGNLTKLKNLSIFDCRSLQHLPDSIGSLINLVSLSLSACSSLTILPESIGNLTQLENLSVFDCRSLQHLPDSIGLLVNLVSLSLNGCSSLTMLPESIGNLIELENLSAYYCKSLQHLPESIGSLINLVSLSLDGCSSLTMLPKYIGNLTKLENLSASYCRSFQHLPDSIGSLINLVSLSLDGCYSLTMLPESIGSLINLVSLSLDGCSSLIMLPESIGNLKSLTKLNMRGSKVMELPNCIRDLHNLKELDISRPG